MINENFVFVSALLSFFGTYSYLVLTIKGKVKPNKVTWFLWALAPLIAFFAEVRQGVGLISLTTFMAGFCPLLVFSASFLNKKAEWKIGGFDIICGSLSLFGIFLWYITKVGNIAITFGILADGLAAIPTLRKSFYFPETEDYKIYLMSTLGSFITCLTIKDWTFQNAGFPIYLFLISLLLLVFVKCNLRKFLKGFK